jgi:hypothetical protein
VPALREGRGQVLVLEAPPIEVGEPRRRHRPGIEWPIPVASFLAQDSLVLGVGDSLAGPGADVDAPLVLVWRGVARPHGHDGHLRAAKGHLRDGQCGGRDDVPVRLDVGQLQQELIGDGRAGRAPVVPRTDEDHARAAVVGQVVGECAGGFTNGGGRVAPHRLLALDEIGLEVDQHGLEILHFVGRHADLRLTRLVMVCTGLIIHQLAGWKHRPRCTRGPSWRTQATLSRTQARYGGWPASTGRTRSSGSS